MEQLVRECAAAQRVAPEYWPHAVACVCAEAASRVVPRPCDRSPDARKYVKVKLVPAPAASCRYVDAVAVRKNVAHRAMRTRFERPRVLMLSCSLEYQHRDGRLLSIDDVLAQEREYLRLLVSRIAAQRPDIVVCSRMASRLAVEFFLAHGIALVSNTRPALMRRIARYVGAEVLPSVARLEGGGGGGGGGDEDEDGPPYMGRCKSAYVETFACEWGAKTYLFFEGPSDLGGTILLEGPRAAELREVRRVARFGVYAAHTLLAERAFILDASDVGDLSYVHTAREPEPVPPSPAAAPHGDRVLSCSPSVRVLRRRAPVARVLSVAAGRRPGGFCPNPQALTFTPGPPRSEHSRVYLVHADVSGTDVVVAVDAPPGVQPRPQDVRAEAAAMGRSVARTYELAHPVGAYQSMLLVYAVALRQQAAADKGVQASQCIPFEYHRVDYYSGRSDMCLGNFLEQYCFNVGQRCPSAACGRPVLEHERSFLHGGGRVDITVDNTSDAPPSSSSSSPSPAGQAATKPRRLFAADGSGVPVPQLSSDADEDAVLVWSWCRACGHSTQCRPLSRESWSLSLAKFLDLTLHGKEPMLTGLCTHSPRQHVRCFSRRTLVAQFAYSALAVSEVVPPPLRIAADRRSPLTRAEMDRRFAALQTCVSRVYDAIDAHLRTLAHAAESELSTETGTFAPLAVTRLLLSRSSEDREELRSRVAQASLEGGDMPLLAALCRELHEAHASWAAALRESAEEASEPLSIRAELLRERTTRLLRVQREAPSPTPPTPSPQSSEAPSANNSASEIPDVTAMPRPSGPLLGVEDVEFDANGQQQAAASVVRPAAAAAPAAGRGLARQFLEISEYNWKKLQSLADGGSSRRRLTAECDSYVPVSAPASPRPGDSDAEDDGLSPATISPRNSTLELSSVPAAAAAGPLSESEAPGTGKRRSRSELPVPLSTSFKRPSADVLQPVAAAVSAAVAVVTPPPAATPIAITPSSGRPT
eukprot:m51a1_g12928 putative 1-phosphatidylinositol-3-phosphate 5-kinase fab1a (988) ;mRNA; f:71-3170